MHTGNSTSKPDRQNLCLPLLQRSGEVGLLDLRSLREALLISFSSLLVPCALVTASHSSLPCQHGSSTSAHLLHASRASSSAQAQRGATGLSCSLRPTERHPPSREKVKIPICICRLQWLFQHFVTKTSI